MKNSIQSEKLPNGHLFGITSDELNEVLWFDRQFINVLNTISKGAQGIALGTECEDHAIQIDMQMDRLRKVSQLTGIKLKAKENKTLSLLLAEVAEAIERYNGQEALDTVVTCTAQKICCVRRAIYSNLITYLGLMDFEEAELILAGTCQEEEMADDKLQSIAYLKLVPLEDIPKPKKGILAAVKGFLRAR